MTPQNTQQNQQNQSTESKLSLEQFISENDKTLAVIGVFIALAALWLTLPLKTISTFLAFLSIIATFPLFFELYKKLWFAKGTLNLIIFTNIFTLLAGYSIWYVLVAFRPQWKTELYKVVFWTLLLTVIISYKKFFNARIEKWINRKLINLLARLSLRKFKKSEALKLEKFLYESNLSGE